MKRFRLAASARMRKKGMSERGDELLMVELNRLWNLYDVDTQEKVFQCYKDLDEISTSKEWRSLKSTFQQLLRGCGTASG